MHKNTVESSSFEVSTVREAQLGGDSAFLSQHIPDVSLPCALPRIIGYCILLCWS